MYIAPLRSPSSRRRRWRTRAELLPLSRHHLPRHSSRRFSDGLKLCRKLHFFLLRCGRFCTRRERLRDIEDQLQSARRQVSADQAPVRVHRPELLRLPGRAGRPDADHGRVAPLPGLGRVRAINELKPVLGLELTATPMIETPRARSVQERDLQTTPWAQRWRMASSKSRPWSRARTSTRPACPLRRSSG